jgi:hypothetical protein
MSGAFTSHTAEHFHPSFGIPRIYLIQYQGWNGWLNYLTESIDLFTWFGCLEYPSKRSGYETII